MISVVVRRSGNGFAFRRQFRLNESKNTVVSRHAILLTALRLDGGSAFSRTVTSGLRLHPEPGLMSDIGDCKL